MATLSPHKSAETCTHSVSSPVKMCIVGGTEMLERTCPTCGKCVLVKFQFIIKDESSLPEGLRSPTKLPSNYKPPVPPATMLCSRRLF